VVIYQRHSIAGQWLEYYKNCAAKTPEKVKHLESNSKRSDHSKWIVAV